jgi:hypothetical protein
MVSARGGKKGEKGELVVSHLSDLVHLGSGRAPWVVRSCITDFGLDV